jgi:three-Cys-motif partner protein
MSDQSFFEDPQEHSLVKTTIVAKYFRAWSRVLLKQTQKRESHIAYIDLFAGPGKFADGTKSTPIIILEMAVKDPDLRARLIPIFNDRTPSNVESLRSTIRSIPNINLLQHQPRVENLEVGTDLARAISKVKLVPTLLFVDPWGYKGLSRELIGSVLRNFGSDCIFFFNYRRINAALHNDQFKPHMDAIFGAPRVDRLRSDMVAEDLSPERRELAIIEALFESLRETYGRYVLPFRFRDAHGTRTSHHLVFVTKHPLGYEIMKEIMAKESSTTDQGVPSFEYNKATEDEPLLFELSRPLDDLKEMLLAAYAGRTLSMAQIYEDHHVDRPYIKSNYKTVLTQLEQEGRMHADPPASRRKIVKAKLTFPDTVMVTFLRREE